MESGDLTANQAPLTPDIGAIPEKMVPQSVVNKLIGSAKAEAAERARREFQEQQPVAQPELSDKESLYAEFRSRIDEDNARKREEEQVQKQQEDYTRYINDVAHKFMSKYEVGKKNFEDFDTVTEDLNLGDFGNVVVLAADLDDPAAVMYELSKRPTDLWQLNELAQRSPTMAMRELKTLVGSINQNQEAMQAARQNGVEPPNPRLKSSVMAGADSGMQTISDLRKLPNLRG
jgi:hypothetical protein